MNVTRLTRVFVKSFLFVLCAFPRSSQAQGTFQNLNFELAAPISVGGGEPTFVVTTASALPYWTVYYGSVQQTQISYNDAVLGGEPWLTLSATGYPGVPEEVIDGRFTPFLQGGEVNGVSTAVSITQTGQIPFGTQSLLFDSAGNPFQMAVLIGNQEVSLVPVGGGPDYTIYGGNISAWAGQTEQLTFSASLGNWAIDDITFSTQAVPEPNTVELVLTAATMLGLQRWRKASQS